MRRSPVGLALSLSLMSLAGCGLWGPEYRTERRGVPVAAPPRFANGVSCPSAAALNTVDGRLQVVVGEQTDDQAFLGRLRLSDGLWQQVDHTTHSPFHMGFISLSVDPQGEVFAGIYAQMGAEERPDLRRTGRSGWEEIGFAVPLNWERQNFPTALSLGNGRAVVSIFETGGSTARRQSAFILQGGSWIAVEEASLATSWRRTFHRGTEGQLWRATYPTTDAGEISFHRWTGSEWTDLGLRLAVTEEGYLTEVVDNGGRLFALYNTTRFSPQGTSFRLYEWIDGVAVSIAREPTPLFELHNLSFDSFGQPLLSFSGYEENAHVARVLRLEQGAWETVFEARLPRMIRFGSSTVVGDQLLVGWTESAQVIDTGFQHYTDCDLRFEQVSLADPVTP